MPHRNTSPLCCSLMGATSCRCSSLGMRRTTYTHTYICTCTYKTHPVPDNLHTHSTHKQCSRTCIDTRYTSPPLSFHLPPHITSTHRHLIGLLLLQLSCQLFIPSCTIHPQFPVHSPTPTSLCHMCCIRYLCVGWLHRLLTMLLTSMCCTTVILTCIVYSCGVSACACMSGGHSGGRSVTVRDIVACHMAKQLCSVFFTQLVVNVHRPPVVVYFYTPVGLYCRLPCGWWGVVGVVGVYVHMGWG